MSDLYTAQGASPLSDCCKPKVKFCFATIFFALFALLGIINLVRIFENYFGYTLGQLEYVSADMAVKSIVSFALQGMENIISTVGFLALIVYMFFKRPNILVAVFLGISTILPSFIRIVRNLFIFIYVSTVSYISTVNYFNFVFSCLMVTLCVLFALKSPGIMAFMRKKRYIWVGLSFLALGCLVFDFIDLVSEYQTFSGEFYFMEEYENLGEFLLSHGGVMVGMLFGYAMEGIEYFLLLRWLSDPYKKAKPANASVAPLPQVPERIGTPVHVETVRPVYTQSSSQFTEKVGSNAIDDIIRAKELLDSGVITVEEFEKIKSNIIK